MMNYTEEQLALLGRVEQYLAEHPKVSQNELGKMIGFTSGSILSSLRKGTYKTPEAAFQKIAAYFEVKDAANKRCAEVHYAPTNISSHIYGLIGVCQAAGGLTIAVGDAGIGKTKAAQKFHEDNPTNSYYLTINPCLTSVKSLLKAIASEIGATVERSVDDLWLSIVKKLSDGTVLIFDEAQNLTIKEIETLRSFSDYFHSKGQTLGICFIGNPEAVVYMSRKAEFAQISNRVRLRRFYTSDQITIEDIKMLFPILSEQHMQKEIEFLHKIACTPQALRGAVGVFMNAYANKDYTLDGLKVAAAYAEIEV
ncbi:MAG: ATP-binding protein [Oscillospiraceae bacterium]|nr:ATP-binding protein [Oscillospiraceae bacterium]